MERNQNESVTRVVNRYKEPFDVYIGRGSMWGNPYSHKDGTLAAHQVATVEEAVESYRCHLMQQIATMEITTSELRALEGKTLGCFCKPKPCHGDAIIEVINWIKRYD